ncbi:4'-phosphopantetheinyl transferase family protein [Chitinophaga sp. GCM10012297]|uniref:4'-phosphopantetheinyl transferase superfamily protein n=1 Tax=Chitinophaga chungangae TaxID=2821488 RepID=A0ABS3Y9R5_9BACT|nr:4'-phosphopantetheinyl transferase superfamily protein [Chitinophaga chungangae]MBO9151396.1 4'-phosphopantetheinyl transferase superfamily protein [Chitinophaga chungangae]
MALIRTIQIDPATKLGVWKIGEEEAFFRSEVIIEPGVHHPHKRLQHFAGRYLLRQLFPDLPVNEIRILESRKPYIPGNPYYFSISHCGDFAAAIVSTREHVGIDIENVQPKIGRVAHKFLAPREAEFMSAQHRLQHQTVCWSAKEAVYKWYGLGGLDFKANMQLQAFPFQNTGFITCDFLKEDRLACLDLQYILEDNLCLAWTAGERKQQTT